MVDNFGTEQESIVSEILWKALKGQSKKDALKIMEQCIYYITAHPELYKKQEKLNDN